MIQNNFGEKIKKIRKDNNLTQKQLADLLNVTYQAVSKWENNKNLPDISIMKEISKKFNIDINYLMDINTKKQHKSIIYFIPIIVILIIIIISIIYNVNNSDFQMKTISTTCNNFNLSGSIAYNKTKTSIYISEINYCGLNEDKQYKKITCTLYEKANNKENIIEKCETKTNITLNNYLNNLKFHIDNYKASCQKYSENSLYIKMELISSKEKTLTYTIPLSLKDNCSH